MNYVNNNLTHLRNFHGCDKILGSGARFRLRRNKEKF